MLTAYRQGIQCCVSKQYCQYIKRVMGVNFIFPSVERFRSNEVFPYLQLDIQVTHDTTKRSTFRFLLVYFIKTYFRFYVKTSSSCLCKSRSNPQKQPVLSTQGKGSWSKKQMEPVSGSNSRPLILLPFFGKIKNNVLIY